MTRRFRLTIARYLTCASLLPGLFISGCLNAGSAPTYQDLLTAQGEAEQAIKAKGSIEKKKYPIGEGNVVDLHGATIADSDVEYLKELGAISELDLSGSTITDAQLANLVATNDNGERQVAVLFRLDVSETSISDAGLKELEPLGLLAQLNVKGSQVTDAGINSFKSSRNGKPAMRKLKLKIDR